jgi:hypothetical protein
VNQLMTKRCSGIVSHACASVAQSNATCMSGIPALALVSARTTHRCATLASTLTAKAVSASAHQELALILKDRTSTLTYVSASAYNRHTIVTKVRSGRFRTATASASHLNVHQDIFGTSLNANACVCHFPAQISRCGIKRHASAFVSHYTVSTVPFGIRTRAAVFAQAKLVMMDSSST